VPLQCVLNVAFSWGTGHLADVLSGYMYSDSAVAFSGGLWGG
jgi:hypothetical protein